MYVDTLSFCPRLTSQIYNIGGIFHDPGTQILGHFSITEHNPSPDIFEEPEVFRPERYLLTEHGTKPGVDSRDFRATLPFGSGRVRLDVHLYNVGTLF